MTLNFLSKCLFFNYKNKTRKKRKVNLKEYLHITQRFFLTVSFINTWKCRGAPWVIRTSVERAGLAGASILQMETAAASQAVNHPPQSRTWSPAWSRWGPLCSWWSWTRKTQQRLQGRFPPHEPHRLFDCGLSSSTREGDLAVLTPAWSPGSSPDSRPPPGGPGLAAWPAAAWPSVREGRCEDVCSNIFTRTRRTR